MIAPAVVLGLDPSLTSFGVAAMKSSGVASTKLLKPVDRRGVARLMWFRDALGDELLRFEPDLVVVEGYAFARANQAHYIGELGGVVKMLLLQDHWETLIVPPASLKKFVAGKGNAQKDQMRLEAFKRFALEAKTQDEVEAACLAAMGWRWLAKEGRIDALGVQLAVPKENLKALEKVSVLE